MIEIKKDMSKVPDWLVVDKTLVPDFVVKGKKSFQSLHVRSRIKAKFFKFRS